MSTYLSVPMRNLHCLPPNQNDHLRPAVVDPAGSLQEAGTGRRDSSKLSLGGGGSEDFELGGWTVRPTLNRLESEGSTVNLEPRPMSLLVFLAERRGQVASKAEIFEQVWQAQFVADSALTRSVADLRRALGDNAQQPTFIETIPKRGYRLIAPIVRPEPPRSKRSPAQRWLLAMGVGFSGLALVLGAALAVDHWGTSSTSTGGRIDSLAVLPLEDLSATSEEGYFADAMTEALTTHLASLGTVRVISGSSVQAYRDRGGSFEGLARNLGVDAVVEGSVLRAGGKVRISARLIELATGTVRWASSYERDFANVLVLQSDVVGAIVREMRAKVKANEDPAVAATLSAEVIPVGTVREVDPAAHDLYLRGRSALKRSWREGPNEAVDYFHQALAIDPGFAPSQAGIADYYSRLTMMGFLRPHDGFPKARAAAHRALESDQNLAEAHAALATVEFMFDWDWQEAEAEYRWALELNPNSAAMHKQYSVFLTSMGRFDEALREARIMQELDPLSGDHHLAWVLFNARRYEESLAELGSLEHHESCSVRAWNLALLGRHDEATTLFETAEVENRKQGRTSSEIDLGVQGWNLASAGKLEQSMVALEHLRKSSQKAERDLYPQVIVLAGQGETERALTLLEQAVIQRSPNAIYLLVEPFLDPIRSDPRYSRLLETTGLARVDSDSDV